MNGSLPATSLGTIAAAVPLVLGGPMRDRSAETTPGNQAGSSKCLAGHLQNIPIGNRAAVSTFSFVVRGNVYGSDPDGVPNWR